MGKRFTETQKWQDPWFMDLPMKYKLFWFYLVDSCDYVGVWEVNWKVAQFIVGDNFEPTEMKRIFKDRIMEFNEGRHWYLKKFIEFQQGTTILDNRLIHKNIYNKLQKYGIFEESGIFYHREALGAPVDSNSNSNSNSKSKGFKRKVYVDINKLIEIDMEKRDIFEELKNEYSEHELNIAWEDIAYHKEKKK